MMSRAHKILSAPKRLMRSRGFGVHSPFAYTFIRDVIDSPCRYYAHDNINIIARKHGAKRRRLDLIFRIACRFDFRDAFCSGRSATAMMHTLALSHADFKPTPAGKAPSLVAADCGCDEASTLDQARKAIAAGGAIVLFDINSNDSATHTIWRIICDEATIGMAFAGSSTGIFIASPHLPRQDHSIWI